jgi:predicted nicotinamide N-methyase
MTGGDSAGGSGGDGVLDWTAPGTAPLVPEITLLLADDIHRTWSALDEEAPPFWAFAWVGGQALARYVLDHPDLVRGRRVLDLASGSGLVAIAAARAGATAVIASDTDARSRTAIGLNAAANGVEVAVLGDVLDGQEELDVDLVLAGDVFYEEPMARHVERFCDEASAAGVDVVVGDPGREYLPRRRVAALGRYDVTGTLDLEGGATTTTTVYRFT